MKRKNKKNNNQNRNNNSNGNYMLPRAYGTMPFIKYFTHLNNYGPPNK